MHTYEERGARERVLHAQLVCSILLPFISLAFNLKVQMLGGQDRFALSPPRSFPLALL